MKTICFIALILSLTLVRAEKCTKYVYDSSLPDGVCRKTSSSEDQKTVLLNSCLSGKKTFCPLTDNAQCEEEPPVNSLPRYPGNKCSSDAKDEMECEKGSTCSEGVCVGSKADETCDSHAGCNAGLACIKGKCASQLAPGQQCADSFECANNSSCNKGVCETNFSLANETEIDSRQVEQLCNSGWAYESEGKTFCGESTLKTKGECTDTCTYQVNGKDLQLADRCRCGFNAEGKSYCEPGSDSIQLRNKIAYLKKVAEHSSKIHTLSRQNGFSIDKPTGVQTQIAIALADNKAQLTATPPKVTGLVLPQIRKHVFNNYCPKFFCSMIDTYCVKALRMDYLDSAALVRPCPDDQVCKVSTIAQIADLSHGEEETCTAKPSAQSPRYPGEKCDQDADCENNQCKDKVCSGVGKDQKCAHTKECLVGLACRNNTCVAQTSAEECTEQFDCPNEMGCFQNKCHSYFSLDDDTDLSSIKDAQNTRFLCKSGYLTQEHRCFSRDYSPATKARLNDDGLAECLRGVKECTYSDSPDKAEDCKCGFNPEGFSYCPVPYAADKPGFDAFFAKLKESFKNECHTLNRFSCYAQDHSTAKELRALEYETQSKHINFGKQDCIDKMFNGAASFVGVSVLIAFSLWL